jgi:molybdenum cofactor cytidylyltransferase
VIFGPTPLDSAEGAILAHSVRLGEVSFKKGRRLSLDDLEALRREGVNQVTAARLENDDIHEDEAAARLAAALLGENLSASRAFTGRANLVATGRGVLEVDRERLDRLNLVHEAITVATLPPFDTVEPQQLAATIKIIPFAVPVDTLEACIAIAREDGPLLRVHAYQNRRIGLVQTRLPGTKESTLEKTREAIDHRLAALGCPKAMERRVGHEPEAVAGALAELRDEGADLLLVSGASAIVARRDVVPLGIEAAGGKILHFGMPVDPGNLILLAYEGARPLLGLPGCARSPKINGFDWVLQRLVAGMEVTPKDIMLMGAGGLLKEIGSRPLPRSKAVESTKSDDNRGTASQAPRIAALILAAGQSHRMGRDNKLLSRIEEKPMVRHVAEAALASQAKGVIVVTGHEADKLEHALAGLDLEMVHNPDYERGISASLHRGLSALPGEADGVVVLLGDMPGVGAEVIDRLIAAFNPVEGREICIPTWEGKRGNPVLIARRFFSELQEIGGDVGAKAMIGEYPEAVVEVAMDSQGVLQDIDTPEALAAFTRETP